MASDDFRKDLAIDRYALDDECADHANRVADWGLKWADAVAERDRLEDVLTLVRGQCDQEIREDPAAFGWQKPDKPPTEAFIASAIFTHKAYVEAKQELQEAKHEVDVLAVAKNAFEHRDKRIADLVKLYGSGYYSANRKLGEGPANVVSGAVSTAQTEALGKNPRLARRTTGEG